MDRRQFLKHIGGLATGLGISASRFGSLYPDAEAVEPKRPNLLFVFADQMRAFAMGCMGNEVVQTPNLDRLAAEGVLFTHGYSCSPLCSPDRACLLTGLYPHTHGVVTNKILLSTSIPTIADVLKSEGYSTGYVGKWHLDGTAKPGFVPPGERRQGFDFWAAFNRGHEYTNSTYYRDENVPIKETQFEPDYQTDIAIDFIQNSAKESDQPFCLYLSWGPPHTPYNVPAEYLKIYSGKEMPLRPNIPGSALARAKDEIPSYYALVTSLDYNMGRLMQVLDDTGLADDTIVVFTADHGDMLGSQNKFRKRLPWEESSHVPLIIRYPRWLPVEQSSDILFNSVDLMPTLLTLCDAPIPEGVQGIDLSSWISGGGVLPGLPDAVYLEMLTKSSGANSELGNWRAIRTHDWMYARHENASGGWLLYDMNADPYQRRNRIRDAGSEMIRKELDGRLTDWVNATTIPHAVEGYDQPVSKMDSDGEIRYKAQIRLMQNYPNPSNPGTWIPYQLDTARNVEIYIHDAVGRLQRKLSIGVKSAGTYTTRQRAAYWDGRNQFGETVSTGIYFYTLKAGDFSTTRKMTVKR